MHQEVHAVGAHIGRQRDGSVGVEVALETHGAADRPGVAIGVGVGIGFVERGVLVSVGAEDIARRLLIDIDGRECGADACVRRVEVITQLGFLLAVAGIRAKAAVLVDGECAAQAL